MYVITDDELKLLQNWFEQAHPQVMLRWAVETFKDDFVVVTSFQPTGIATLHLLAQFMVEIPVITLDTHLLFPETYALQTTLQDRFNLRLTQAAPRLTLDQQAEQYGPNLWETQPDVCCHLRKTRPLQEALGAYGVWSTGLRRDQSLWRATQVQPLVWDHKHGLWKLSPFAAWTEQMVWDYIHQHDLPYNPLHNQGYASIGCYPCTQPASDATDLRSGRWVNQPKTECGIHLPNQPATASKPSFNDKP